MQVPKPYPRLSIITPSFNQAGFLEETIRSVLEQGYPDIEYMVIDGGSTDNSVDVLRKYEDRLAYWVSERDRGQADAINRGMKRATGEIVAYLNSDDCYVPGTFEFVRQQFAEDPRLDFLYGDTELIDGEGRTIGVHKEVSFDFLMGCFIGFGLIIPQPSAFWKRRIFEEAGYLDSSFAYNMDGEFFSRAVRERRVVHAARVLSRTRLHAASKTARNIDRRSGRHRGEHLLEIVHSYESLWFSHIVPFRLSKPLRWTYRGKRIIRRLLAGHYGKGYRHFRHGI